MPGQRGVHDMLAACTDGPFKPLCQCYWLGTHYSYGCVASGPDPKPPAVLVPSCPGSLACLSLRMQPLLSLHTRRAARVGLQEGQCC
jgi:hypothetical protein